MRLLNVPLACVLLSSSAALGAPHASLPQTLLPHDDNECIYVYVYKPEAGTDAVAPTVLPEATSVPELHASAPVVPLLAGSNSTALGASGMSATASSAASAAFPNSSSTATPPPAFSSAVVADSASPATAAAATAAEATLPLSAVPVPSVSSSSSSSLPPPSSAAAASSASSFPSPTTSGGSSGGAKGVGCWAATNDVQNIVDVGASWTYDWGPEPSFESNLPASIEFVPMIWAPNQDTQSSWDSIKAAGANYSHILGFNEPDASHIDVQSAIDIYPKLQATGLKIGSPAPAQAKLDGSDWFDTFMAQVKEQNLPLDFIALHHYADVFEVESATATFKAYVEAVHAKYPYPIWITEYAMVSYDNYPTANIPDDNTQAAYATASTQMLQSLGYVERFAWFALPYSTSQPACNLYNGSTITQTGKAYKAT